MTLFSATGPFVVFLLTCLTRSGPPRTAVLAVLLTRATTEANCYKSLQIPLHSTENSFTLLITQVLENLSLYPQKEIPKFPKNALRTRVRGGMNDLSGAAAGLRRCWDPIPSPIPCILVTLFLVGLGFSIFILAVVGNASSLVFLLLLSLLVLLFILWNLYKFRTNGSLLLFLNRMPLSDLRTAKDGQIVKITGFASCGDVPLESSYEKIARCVYSSTLLYEYRGFGSKLRNASRSCINWDLTYVERCIADFYITDLKSGTRALVKVGSNSKINPLVTEGLIINTSSRNRELSSTLKKWLGERRLSTEPRLLRVKEGYIKEGSSLTVMGMLSREDGVLMIIQPPEPITTGCMLQKCLLPIDVDGLVLRLLKHDCVLTPTFTDQNFSV